MRKRRWPIRFLGTLYYTTFAAGTNLHRVDFNWDGSIFALSNNTGLANLSGADGLLFGPNGNLLVGAQANNIIEVTPTGTVVTNRNPGGGSFHLGLVEQLVHGNRVQREQRRLRQTHCISAVQLSAGRGCQANGFLYTVSGTNTSDLDVRGVIFDPANNTWYYGTAGDGATNGEFGTVVFDDTLHTASLTRLLSNVPAHGLTYDPFTTDIIFSSDTLIEQYRAGTGVVSTINFGGDFQFDQTAVDGIGSLVRRVQRRIPGIHRLRRDRHDRDRHREKPVPGVQSGRRRAAVGHGVRTRRPSRPRSRCSVSGSPESQRRGGAGRTRTASVRPPNVGAAAMAGGGLDGCAPTHAVHRTRRSPRRANCGSTGLPRDGIVPACCPPGAR